MKFEELPKPLQDWLGELEGFHIRVERLFEEAKTDPPQRMLDWLLEAYRIGQAEDQAVLTAADDVCEWLDSEQLALDHPIRGAIRKLNHEMIQLAIKGWKERT